MADPELISQAFMHDRGLAERVQETIERSPQEASLLFDIARYVRLHSTTANGSLEDSRPAAKKRRLESDLTDSPKYQTVFAAKDISFSIPIRKKLHLEIARESSEKGAAQPAYQVRARNPASGETEFEVCMKTIKHAFRLPVPEKVQRQHNYVLLQEFGLGIGDSPANAADQREPLLWTVGGGPQQITSFESGEAVTSQDPTMFETSLASYLSKSAAIQLTQVDNAEFVSATPEAHRKGEEAYHVKAFRGSKEGFLFLLSTGIFFGFKKPLAFFPLEVVQSISYTSVLQRTFNLSIAAQHLGQEEVNEHEFSMLDQVNFAGIDAYIRRHGLQDASLAESRKAKPLPNHSKRDQQAEGEPGESELQKAQQEMEDAEDEEEEDYDPGSEGDSDGSGTDSEEGSAGGDEAGAGDMVADELGSEAEEVEPDLEDDDQL